MILTKVILKDYGVYRGKYEFDFTCTRDKPVILVGGTNGAGKTTLFESIMLCLYGASMMGSKNSKKSYEEFLARKIHRYLESSTSADVASIIVEFKFYHGGKETEYQVERMWSFDGTSVDEQLSIKKKQSNKDKFEPLDVDESQWQSFIEDMIPKGILNLFFFDGEKIVEIAKKEKEDIAIRDSFKSLLGLDIIEQIKTDLQVNLVRNLTSGGKSLQHDFDKHKEEKEQSLKLVNRLRDKLAQKQNELDAIQLESESLENKLSKIGGGFATNREETKIKMASKSTEHEQLQKKLQEMCMGVLPFSMIPDELDNLVKQIQKDESLQKYKIEKNILESKIKDVNNSLKKKSFWSQLNLDAETSKKIQSKISSLLEKNLDVSIKEKMMFDFSSRQSSKILNIIQESNTTALKEFAKEAKKIIVINDDIEKMQRSITNTPDDDEIGPLVSKLGEMKTHAGQIQAEMEHIEEQISSNDSLCRHIDAKIRDIVSQMYRDEKSKTKVDLTQKVQLVLDEFIEKLKVKKIKLLETYLLDALQTLLHKKDFIGKVVINPETFEVVLFRKNNDLLPKNLLSEGEKQMFVTAILWALTKTSGKPLPFMIDTPLARLDEAHRKNIVEKFLPFASHQILIFSTDKEIELEDYEKLQPYMARSYAMEYQHQKGATKKHNGYFWNEKGEKIIAV